MRKIKAINLDALSVQSVRSGRKTQTRIPVKYKKEIDEPKIGFSIFSMTDPNKVATEFSVRGIHKNGQYGESLFKMPYLPGDILWVRETFTKILYVDENGNTDVDDERIYYFADGIPDIELRDADGFPKDDQRIRWKSPLSMKMEDCRMWLEIINIKVERLEDICHADMMAEGIGSFTKDDALFKYGIDGWSWAPTFDSKKPCMQKTMEAGFFEFWKSVYGGKGLKKNPWVWVINFKKVDKPVNFIPDKKSKSSKIEWVDNHTSVDNTVPHVNDECLKASL